ncbi:hypothetical protein VNO78_21304 [Psophocarpus tetragonolobus]|uniref:Uncharacterized protein n=1 Tax=Psophocarpus tetragonolobus TaxID=3891 RepID=A0AAN9SAX4_PSOTE
MAISQLLVVSITIPDINWFLVGCLGNLLATFNDKNKCRFRKWGVSCLKWLGIGELWETFVPTLIWCLMLVPEYLNEGLAPFSLKGFIEVRDTGFERLCGEICVGGGGVKAVKGNTQVEVEVVVVGVGEWVVAGRRGDEEEEDDNVGVFSFAFLGGGNSNR